MYSLDPENAMGCLLLGVLLIATPFVLGDYFGGLNFFDFGFITVGSIVLAAAIVFLFGRIMTAKSLLGARTLIQIRGFQEFMTRVDGDRLRRMPPDTFEKFLPYAMALGVEQRWAKAFSGIIQNPPSWYAGPSMAIFNPFLFSQSLGNMSTQAFSAFTAAPRASSTGAGFSGSGGGPEVDFREAASAVAEGARFSQLLYSPQPISGAFFDFPRFGGFLGRHLPTESILRVLAGLIVGTCGPLFGGTAALRFCPGIHHFLNCLGLRKR